MSVTQAPPQCQLDAHAWTAASNEDGDYYEVCEGCGKQAAWKPQWPGDVL